MTLDDLDDIPLGSLIITTREEMDRIDYNNILLDTELDQDLAIVKAKILYRLNERVDDTLTIGIDPGKRIGVSVLYMHEEILSRVLTSIKDLLDLMELLACNISYNKMIVKIGAGNMAFALSIADAIDAKLNGMARIELVDEHGTTSSIKDKEARRRGVRDKVSARVIARRRGVDIKDYKSYTL